MSQELLARAASCYLRAGWLAEAGRCFEGAQQPAEAARIREQLGEWPQAAALYERAGLDSQAARCFLEAGLPLQAAECLLRAGEALAAAWVLADRVGQPGRARAVAEDVAADGATTRARRELVLGRCEAELDEPAQAARRLRGVIDTFGELSPGPLRRELEDWGAALATRLDRPDLAAMLHAVATRAGSPGAAERWEAWALERLGDASGIPQDVPPPWVAESSSSELNAAGDDADSTVETGATDGGIAASED